MNDKQKKEFKEIWDKLDKEYYIKKYKEYAQEAIISEKKEDNIKDNIGIPYSMRPFFKNYKELK